MYDVIIVGAGIAGTVLAEKLVKQGYDILVIEKSRKLKIDSGIVASRNLKKTIPLSLIEHKINEMALVSPSGMNIQIKTTKPFAFILDRQKLNRYFIKNVKDSIVYDDVKKITWEDGFVQVICENKRYYGKMVVGCDGANSVVRQNMCFYDNFDYNPEIGFGVLGFDKIISGSIHVYFNKLFSKDFFAWTIPQNNEYGLMSGKDPIEFINHFRKRLGYELKDFVVYPMTIGVKRAVTDRCLLVGESSGYSKPITGGGIDLAIVSANYAFIAINNCIKYDDFSRNSLALYENMCKNDFYSEIKKQLFLRKMYMKLNNEQIDELFKICKKWVEDIDYIEDYIELTDLIKYVSKSSLFLWGLRNFGTLIK